MLFARQATVLGEQRGIVKFHVMTPVIRAASVKFVTGIPSDAGNLMALLSAIIDVETNVSVDQLCDPHDIDILCVVVDMAELNRDLAKDFDVTGADTSLLVQLAQCSVQ